MHQLGVSPKTSDMGDNVCGVVTFDSIPGEAPEDTRRRGEELVRAFGGVYSGTTVKMCDTCHVDLPIEWVTRKCSVCGLGFDTCAACSSSSEVCFRHVLQPGTFVRMKHVPVEDREGDGLWVASMEDCQGRLGLVVRCPDNEYESTSSCVFFHDMGANYFYRNDWLVVDTSATLQEEADINAAYRILERQWVVPCLQKAHDNLAHISADIITIEDRMLLCNIILNAKRLLTKFY